MNELVHIRKYGFEYKRVNRIAKLEFFGLPVFKQVLYTTWFLGLTYVNH